MLPEGIGSRRVGAGPGYPCGGAIRRLSGPRHPYGGAIRRAAFAAAVLTGATVADVGAQSVEVEISFDPRAAARFGAPDDPLIALGDLCAASSTTGLQQVTPGSYWLRVFYGAGKDVRNIRVVTYRKEDGEWAEYGHATEKSPRTPQGDVNLTLVAGLRYEVTLYVGEGAADRSMVASACGESRQPPSMRAGHPENPVIVRIRHARSCPGGRGDACAPERLGGRSSAGARAVEEGDVLEAGESLRLWPGTSVWIRMPDGSEVEVEGTSGPDGSFTTFHNPNPLPLGERILRVLGIDDGDATYRSSGPPAAGQGLFRLPTCGSRQHNTSAEAPGEESGEWPLGVVIETPRLRACPSGTVFRVVDRRREDATTVQVAQGRVEVAPKNASLRSVVLEARQQVTVTSNSRGSVTAYVPRGAAGAARAIEADRTEVRRGQLTRVYIRLRNPGGVANMDYELRYDPAVVRPEGEPLAGNLLRGEAIFESNPSERGRIRMGFAGTEGLDRDGTLTVIPFRATGAPGSRTDLVLSTPVTEDAGGGSLAIDRVDGAIGILREGGGEGGEEGPDGSGDGSGGDRLPDCNNDGRINALDADCALEMSVGTRPVDLGMDADGNRDVTSGDARAILQSIRDGSYRP